MNLYEITFRSASYYAEAESYAEAISLVMGQFPGVNEPDEVRCLTMSRYIIRKGEKP